MSGGFYWKWKSLLGDRSVCGMCDDNIQKKFLQRLTRIYRIFALIKLWDIQ